MFVSMSIAFSFAHLALALLALASLLFEIWCIKGVIDAPGFSAGGRFFWIAVILLFPTLGGVAWLIRANRLER